MVPDGFNVSAHAQDGDGEIGQDDDDLAIINDADDSKVITRSPAKPFQLGRISIFCILINKMIGSYLPLDHQAVSGQCDIGIDFLIFLLLPLPLQLPSAIVVMSVPSGSLDAPRAVGFDIDLTVYNYHHFMWCGCGAKFADSIGIFDNPSNIMYGTRSVGVTLIFWLLGSIAAFAGTLVFIEYGLTIPRWSLTLNNEKIFTPRSGGEFNYLNYLIKTPKFFASCVYGVIFVVIGNAAANALSFASHIVTASGYDAIDGIPSKGVSNTVRGVAVATMTAVCLLHGIWRRAGIAVNNAFAIFKLLMLLMIIILGLVSIGGGVFDAPPPAADNLAPSNSFKNAQTGAYGYAEAYLGVVFAYGGFNQANYVLGEIKNPRKIFRSATLLAVATVSVSYILVNIAYMIVVPASSQVDGNVAEQFILLTLGRVSPYGQAHSAQIFNTFMAFSSLGNVIVSTYTAARVKQEIAKEGILPFSKLIARNYDALSRLTSCFRPRSSSQPGRKSQVRDLVWHEKTPLGALLVHWFFSLLIILCTWGVTSPVTAYVIVFGIYSYTIDAFMSVTIGVGLLVLRFWRSKTHWDQKSPSNGIISIVSAFLFIIANLFPVIALWIPPTGEFTELQTYPWFLVPTVSVLLMLSAFLYWVVFVGLVPRIGGNRGKVLRVERTPFFHTEDSKPVQVAEIVAYNWVIGL